MKQQYHMHHMLINNNTDCIQYNSTVMHSEMINTNDASNNSKINKIFAST